MRFFDNMFEKHIRKNIEKYLTSIHTKIEGCDSRLFELEQKLEQVKDKTEAPKFARINRKNLGEKNESE